jgi:glycosyltransferase involved in cell wall biosynthesis
MTPLVYNMCKMLYDNGHHVTFYGAAGSNPPCSEFVEIVPQELIAAGLVVNEFGVPVAAWKNDPKSPAWQSFVAKGRLALRERYRMGDISLISFGRYQTFVAEESTLSCEVIVGYSGFFSWHKVFPSHAWRHYLYGELKMERHPNWADTVIPHYLDLNDFPYQEKKDDYLLCLGRLDRDKGTDLAIDIANRSGQRIIVAGADMVTHDIPDWLKNLPGNIEFTGYIGVEKRLELLRGAKALLHPCRWLEPFGMVLIEALACGTPIITSNWGAPTEIVQQGVTGFCCEDMEEFVDAVGKVSSLKTLDCRRDAETRFSLEAAYPQYLRYFRRMEKLLGGGWYETRGTWRGPAVAERVAPLQRDGNLFGAEIGVDRGSLAGYLLRELPNLSLYMIDTWAMFPEDSSYAKSGDGVITRTQAQRDEDLVTTMRVTKNASTRRCIMQCTSEEAAKEILDGSLDFVFIDADHSYEGVTDDIKRWKDKVRSGGFLCFHDYGMEIWYPDWGVTSAVDEFAKSLGQAVDRGADWTAFVRIP